MPWLDGSGPLGMGPMTGRGMGMCIMGADALRRTARAGRALGRGAVLGLGPGLDRGMGLGLASGLGRGMARGLGCAAVLGLGYGYARARRQRSMSGAGAAAERQSLQRRKESLENQLAAVNQRLERIPERE